MRKDVRGAKIVLTIIVMALVATLVMTVRAWGGSETGCIIWLCDEIEAKRSELSKEGCENPRIGVSYDTRTREYHILSRCADEKEEDGESKEKRQSSRTGFPVLPGMSGL